MQELYELCFLRDVMRCVSTAGKLHGINQNQIIAKHLTSTTVGEVMFMALHDNQVEMEKSPPKLSRFNRCKHEAIFVWKLQLAQSSKSHDALEPSELAPERLCTWKRILWYIARAFWSILLLHRKQTLFTDVAMAIAKLCFTFNGSLTNVGIFWGWKASVGSLSPSQAKFQKLHDFARHDSITRRIRRHQADKFWVNLCHSMCKIFSYLA